MCEKLVSRVSDATPAHWKAELTSSKKINPGSSIIGEPSGNVG